MLAKLPQNKAAVMLTAMSTALSAHYTLVPVAEVTMASLVLEMVPAGH